MERGGKQELQTWAMDESCQCDGTNYMRWVADASAIGDLIITVTTRNADADHQQKCGTRGDHMYFPPFRRWTWRHADLDSFDADQRNRLI